VSNFGVEHRLTHKESACRKIFHARRNKHAGIGVEEKGGISRSPDQASKGSAIMTIRTRIALAISAAVVSFGVALAPAAFAMDDVKKDNMNKETMSKDAVKKDTMSKDTMKKDDGMAKGSMKKDDGMMKKN
jgi:pentapeptide MXKDX repeat protein